MPRLGSTLMAPIFIATVSTLASVSAAIDIISLSCPALCRASRLGGQCAAVLSEMAALVAAMTPDKRIDRPMLRPGTFALTALLAALSAIGPLTTGLYLPSLPDIARQLDASTAQVQFTISA